MVFITDMLSGGSLRQYMKKIKNIRLKVIKRWSIEILKGLAYLHSNNPPIIHRDLKCDNIFCNSNTGEIRIGDLGLSKNLTSSHAKSVLGTPEFMAPELYEEKYGTSVDIYAFGMCVLEMTTQQTPYHECSNPAQIYKKVLGKIKPQSLYLVADESVREFVDLCIANSSERPTAQKLLEHPFLLDIDNEEGSVGVKLFSSP